MFSVWCYVGKSFIYFHSRKEGRSSSYTIPLPSVAWILKLQSGGKDGFFMQKQRNTWQIISDGATKWSPDRYS